MTLLRKIQEAAVSSDSSITDLLRNCKILASRLSSQELSHWADHELNGYPNNADLPAYRIHKSASRGHFVGAFGRQLRNAEIPPLQIPEELRDLVCTARLSQPIAAYVDIAASKDVSSVQMPWNSSITARLATSFYEDMSCLSAWQVIPRGVIVGLIDSVRNRVLSFALEIEKMAPDAGDAGSKPPANELSETVVQHVFQTTIYGNVGNIASGNHSVTQTADIKVAQGDLTSLRSQLLGLGFAKEEVADLETALATDAAKDPKQIGGSTWKWIGGAMAKAGQGALKISAATTSSVLAKLIAQYLGIHGP